MLNQHEEKSICRVEGTARRGVSLELKVFAARPDLARVFSKRGGLWMSGIGPGLVSAGIEIIEIASSF